MEERTAWDILINLLPTLIMLIGAIGAFIKIFQDSNNRQKELSIEDKKVENDSDKIDLERHSDDIEAAKMMADILSTVVNPLSQRIVLLEESSIRYQKLITELNMEVLDLKRTVHLKDIEIDKLTLENIRLNGIINNQEEKIRIQNDKIACLEEKLRVLEKDNKNG